MAIDHWPSVLISIFYSPFVKLRQLNCLSFKCHLCEEINSFQCFLFSIDTDISLQERKTKLKNHHTISTKTSTIIDTSTICMCLLFICKPLQLPCMSLLFFQLYIMFERKKNDENKNKHGNDIRCEPNNESRYVAKHVE